MASAGELAVEDALDVLVSVTEKGGNLRNDLKKDFLKAVSSLRKDFANFQESSRRQKQIYLRFGNESCGNEHPTQSARVWRG